MSNEHQRCEACEHYCPSTEKFKGKTLRRGTCAGNPTCIRTGADCGTECAWFKPKKQRAKEGAQ